MQSHWSFNFNAKSYGYVTPTLFKKIDSASDLPKFPQMQCNEQLQFIFVESGKTCVAVNDVTYDVGENSVIIYNAYTSHKEIAVNDANVKLYYVSIDGVNENGKPYNHLLSNSDLPFLHLEDFRTFKHYLSEIYDELTNKNDGYQEAVISLVNLIFVMIKRRLGKERFDINENLNDTCRIVKDYIDKNFNKPLRLDELASMVYVSTYGLEHQFKRVTKISPIQYQIYMRITEAKKYLLSTKFSVREIGEMVGYDDPAYFSQIFKKHTGHSPLRYREKFGIGE